MVRAIMRRSRERAVPVSKYRRPFVTSSLNLCVICRTASNFEVGLGLKVACRNGHLQRAVQYQSPGGACVHDAFQSVYGRCDCCLLDASVAEHEPAAGGLAEETGRKRDDR